MDSLDFALGRYIMYDNTLVNNRIGRIEDESQDQGWVEVFEYMKPQETKFGQLPHHGANEIFKTNSLRKYDSKDAVKNVRVVKLREYQDLKFNQQLSMENIYLHRQDYDEHSNIFMPNLEQCVCSQIPNPDTLLVLCQTCNRPYHPECLKQSEIPFYCKTCRSEITDNLISNSYSKSLTNRAIHVPPQDDSPPIEQCQEGEDEDFSLRRPKQMIDLDKLVKKKKTNDKEAQQIKLTNQISSQSKEPVQPIVKKQKESQGKQKVQQFKNISEEQVARIKKWVEKYHMMESHLGNLEKKRQEVRERFFQVIFYGVEELRNMPQDKLTQFETKFINQDENQLFQQIKNLALDIEVLFHIKLNQNFSKMEQAYIDRCKLIYVHMKDDKNFELRRKVINKEFNSNDLCSREEKDFYNPERKKQMQESILKGIEVKVNEEVVPAELKDKPNGNSNIEESNQKEVSRQKEAPQKNIMNDLLESLNEYLGGKGYERYKKRLSSELIGDELTNLLENLNTNFKNRFE